MYFNLPSLLYWKDCFSASAIYLSKTFVFHLTFQSQKEVTVIENHKYSTHSTNNFEGEPETLSIEVLSIEDNEAVKCLFYKTQRIRLNHEPM